MKCQPLSLVLEKLWKKLYLWGAIESLRKIKTNQDGNTKMKEQKGSKTSGQENEKSDRRKIRQSVDGRGHDRDP